MEQSAAEALLTSLAAIAANQDRIHDDLRAMHREQAVINRRLEETSHDFSTTQTHTTTLVMRIARTLDRIDEKLERLLLPPERRP